MEKLVSYLGTVSLQSGIILIVLLLIVVAIIYWSRKAVANNKEKKQKENALVLNIEHAGKFFKVTKLDEKNSGIVFLSFNPNRNYPSGEGGEWFSSGNIPKELIRDAQVLEVKKVSETEIKVIFHTLF